MTEGDWLACKAPGPMLAFLGGRLGERRARLFACACCRRLWDDLERRGRRCVEVGEWHACGLVDERELRHAVQVAYEMYAETDAIGAEALSLGGPPEEEIPFVDIAVVLALTEHASEAYRFAFDPDRGERLERADQAALLREVVGNPFRPVGPAPAREDGTARDLARGIAEDGALDRLPILGDALEEAGCTSHDLLEHLRRPGGHVLGCWALGWVLDGAPGTPERRGS
jgi:hypothetical protein